MKFELPNALAQNRSGNGPAWSGAAFIVEAMLLLAFLIASFAIFTQMFATSAVDAADSQRLSQAVAAATERAERFANDPASANGAMVSGDLRTECSVTPEKRTNGTLYQAVISVYDANIPANASPGNDGALYTITTSRYVSESEVNR